MYTIWANDQLIQWLHSADETTWEEKRPSSFSSLNETTRHLWNAEYGWLTRLKDKPWESIPQVSTKDDVLNGWQTTSRALAKYGLSLLSNDPNGTRRVGDGEMRIDDIIHHVCNHATYHRGQLITIGRQVGLNNPPRTDYVYFMQLDAQIIESYKRQVSAE